MSLFWDFSWRRDAEREWREFTNSFPQQFIDSLEPHYKQLNERDAVWEKYDEWKKEQQKKTQRYAFTITTNVPETEYATAEQEMKTAVVKLFAQKSQEVLKGAAYLEYTSKGAPHIHGWYMIEGGGRIYAKNFKRVWKLWDETKKHGAGFQGGYHAKLIDDRYEKYASAEERLVVKV